MARVLIGQKAGLLGFFRDFVLSFRRFPRSERFILHFDVLSYR
jgi:hypothetical protein